MAGSFGNPGAGDDEIVSGINLTPLVDVVLVLLIIFMITAPTIYQSAIQVKLPKAQSGDSAAGKKKSLHFTVKSDGKIFWDQEQLTLEAVGAKLAKMGPQTDPATIGADESTTHGAVVKLMDVLRQNGITQIGLSVETSQK